MKIAYVNAHYRLDVHDGPNAHSRQFVQNTVQLGHEVWMWPGRSHPLARPLPWSRLARILALRTMDVVYVRLEHAPSGHCAWALRPKRDLLGDPLMVWEFNTVPEFGAYVHVAPLDVDRNIAAFRRFGRGCDLAVCVSQPLADYVGERLGIGSTMVAPNGSDPEHYWPGAPVVRHLRGGDPRALNVLWMGSAYVPWHDLDLLRRASEIIWQRGNPHHVTFHLLGKDVLGMGEMPPNVHYHGMEDYRELPGWLSGMQVGLCLYRPGPADYSSPLKLFDYLSSGLAVVATRQPQITQVLGEMGTPDLVIERGDAEALADRLEGLARDRERTAHIGQQARQLGADRYTWRRTVTVTLAAIEERLAARPGRRGRRLAPPARPAAPAASTANDGARRVPVSVCVATYGRPELLGRLLEGLAGLDPGTPAFEVVVVDNDRKGEAAPVVAKFAGRLAVRLGFEPRQSLSHARNLSVAMARGDFLAFIDDDEVPDPSWLKDLHAAVVAQGADGGFGPVEVRFEEDVPAWIRRSAFFRGTPLATGAAAPWHLTRTGNALIRRSSLPSGLAAFDPRFGRTGGEDSDLFYRMLRQGARFIVVESALVVESRSHHRCSGWWMLKRSFRRGGTVADVMWREMRGPARMRAWSGAAITALREGTRAVRHLRARERAFDHLQSATQSLGMAAAAVGWRYREYRRPG